MVDREMLSAMSDLLEEKLEQKLEEKLEQKLEEKLDQKLDEKLDRKFDEKLQPIYNRLENLDEKVGKLETDMRYVRVVQLENGVMPRLNTIESCYLDSSKRYLERTEQIDSMAADIAILKNVVSNQSGILQQLQS